MSIPNKIREPGEPSNVSGFIKGSMVDKKAHNTKAKILKALKKINERHSQKTEDNPN